MIVCKAALSQLSHPWTSIWRGRVWKVALNGHSNELYILHDCAIYRRTLCARFGNDNMQFSSCDHIRGKGEYIEHSSGVVANIKDHSNVKCDDFWCEKVTVPIGDFTVMNDASLHMTFEIIQHNIQNMQAWAIFIFNPCSRIILNTTLTNLVASLHQIATWHYILIDRI